MSEQDLKDQVNELRQQIRYHDHMYYQLATPEISDLAYDQLLNQLKALEAEYPLLITPDKLTQRLGDNPVEGFIPVVHRLPMLSIDNTYSEAELRSYAQRIQKLLGTESIEWVVELKIDGVAVSLTYEQGRLVQAATRGNGLVGDDITHNARQIKDVPRRLLGENLPEVLEVRGEIYMTNSDLVLLNQEQAAKNQPSFANTRNVVAGTVRLLDPRITATRRLRLFCHGLGFYQGPAIASHTEFLQQIHTWGIPATPHVQSFQDFDSVVEYCNVLIEQLYDLEFEVDGIVVKVNSYKQREQLGNTSKSPRWLIAYKFEKYEAKTRLLDIRVQVGKTGAITPVAELEPVELAGTIVRRASLHNAEEIERKDIRIGDMVIVEKAGKVIPHIVRVETHEREELAPPVPFLFPKTCPACETEVLKDTGGVYIRCPNRTCPAQVKEQIQYFASRNAMDIRGLGDKLIDQLVDRGLVKSYADLYLLKLEDLTQLERVGTRSAQKLLENIAKSKARGLARVLNALSIRNVGSGVAKLLAKRFGTIEALQAATLSELSEIDGVGSIIAESVLQFMQSEFGLTTIQALQAAGVDFTAPESNTASGTGEGRFFGQTFVLTGTLPNYTRDEIQAMIEAHGGSSSSSVSKNTSYVVAGEKAGTKLAKAQELGVPVLTEAEFLELLES